MTTLLEQEIWSQPGVITRLLELETKHIQQIVAQFPAFDYVLIAARGSSDHAATYAKYAWTALAGYPISLRGTPCRVFTSDARVRLSSTRFVYPESIGELR